MIVDAVDVWSSCGCDSYNWDLKKDIEFDVIDVVTDELRSDWRSMRRVAVEMGMSLEQVEDIITKFLAEAVSVPTQKGRKELAGIGRQS